MENKCSKISVQHHPSSADWSIINMGITPNTQNATWLGKKLHFNNILKQLQNKEWCEQ